MIDFKRKCVESEKQLFLKKEKRKRKERKKRHELRLFKMLHLMMIDEQRQNE
jgi:hypothetical protein